MGDRLLKYLVIFVIFIAVLTGCSKEPTKPKHFYNDGIVAFVNSGYYAVVLEQLSQSRDGESESLILNRTIARNVRIDLPNLIDGGEVFKGGDRVSLNYRSQAYDHSGNPYFIRSLSFLVNGSTVVRIKGQNGDYDISDD